MSQAGDRAFRPLDGADLSPRIPVYNATSGTTTTVPCKRKPSADHPEAPPAARRQTFIEDEDALAGQIGRAGATAAKPSNEPVKLDGDQTASKNGGCSDESPCPEPEPAAATATWHGDNTLVSPFGYRTWDPTDGGRYELLSTYTPPQCLDADEEDALWWLAAVYTSPQLYTSPDNVFWGTPDGVWTSY